MNILIGLVLGLIAGLVAAVAVYFSTQRNESSKAETANAEANIILTEARTKAEIQFKEAELKAKDLLVQARTQVDNEIRERRRELSVLETKIESREEVFESGSRTSSGAKPTLTAANRACARARKASATRKPNIRRCWIRRATNWRGWRGLTREEAKRAIIDEIVGQARNEAAKHIRLVEEEAREEADRRAKRILTIAIERMAGEFVAERTVAVVPLPSDEMKGRIIGREGRNIRAIEAATGVDIIIDDTPEAVVISCHNPIRREIARVGLERLISDGRIHPGRIEEVVRKAEQEVEESIREAGQRALLEVGVHGVHPELVKLLGMLKYRYSYAQNVLMHSIEAAFLCGAMAAELGLNEKQARRAALLHDIGKALTHEVEGSHALIGAELARKYGESAKIVNAIAAHHEEVKAETILAPLVDAADALSGARPGARREVLESYVKRLEDLETIAKSFKGVEKCFAVQAGREMRIIVEPHQVTDDDTLMLARDVARKIESEMAYPGQIKVTVIREVRSTELAK